MAVRMELLNMATESVWGVTTEEAENVERESEYRKEMLAKVLTIMQNELTQTQREIVQSVLLEGLTYQEVADARGICRSSVCRTYHRGIDKIQRFTKYIANRRNIKND